MGGIMSKRNNLGLAFLIGAAAGAIATLFMPDKQREQSKKFIAEKTKLLESKLREVDQIDAALKVFDSKSKDAVQYIDKARSMLIVQLSKLKGAVDEIDKDKYSAVVSQVVDQLKKSANLTANQVKKLTSYLEEDYKKLKK